MPGRLRGRTEPGAECAWDSRSLCSPTPRSPKTLKKINKKAVWETAARLGVREAGPRSPKRSEGQPRPRSCARLRHPHRPSPRAAPRGLSRTLSSARPTAREPSTQRRPEGRERDQTGKLAAEASTLVTLSRRLEPAAVARPHAPPGSHPPSGHLPAGGPRPRGHIGLRATRSAGPGRCQRPGRAAGGAQRGRAGPGTPVTAAAPEAGRSATRSHDARPGAAPVQRRQQPFGNPAPIPGPSLTPRPRWPRRRRRGDPHPSAGSPDKAWQTSGGPAQARQRPWAAWLRPRQRRGLGSGTGRPGGGGGPCPCPVARTLRARVCPLGQGARRCTRGRSPDSWNPPLRGSGLGRKTRSSGPDTLGPGRVDLHVQLLSVKVETRAWSSGEKSSGRNGGSHKGPDSI